jgi:mannose/fructose/N-acetylgalactosamine-specific phosphotransferase system component IIB
METCEIYITGVVYKHQSWMDNPDYLLEQIYDNLNEIQNFDFASLSLNMSQVYNVSLKQSNYDAMIMYLKKARYKHQEFLTLTDVENLVIKIKQQLNYITDLSFVGIEVRTSKLYTDKELGLVKTRRDVV